MTKRHTADRSPSGGRSLSHDVRIWKLRVYTGKKRSTYSVRWSVNGQEHHETFATRALADGHRATLISYAQKGMPFDKATGLPEVLLWEQQARPWFTHACDYVDMKWPNIAPKSRTSIADALTTVTPALLRTDRGRPSPDAIRRALYTWAFISPLRNQREVPDELLPTIRWLERNTIPLADLADPVRGPQIIRSALGALASRLDGKPAAPTTFARKRAVFYNALEYAVELGLLPSNPVDHVKWNAPKTEETVDRRVVVNAAQARSLLQAVGEQKGVAQRLVAFFGCMYYAALRPSEALALTRDNLARLPEHGWGELILTRSMTRSGTAWSDSGKERDRRGLKHRGVSATRIVPAHPDLVQLLKAHLAEFGTGRDGLLFVGPNGGTIGESRFAKVWHEARRRALTPAEVTSPLAQTPYSLRHAAVSTWLNAGVPPTQVAEWAGHSVHVLLRTYAKCIVGQEEAARNRIEAAMREARQTRDGHDDD